MNKHVGRDFNGSPASLTMRGVIRFYDHVKGFGFVALDNGTDVFLHKKCVERSRVSPDRLTQDTRVRFALRPLRPQEGKRAEISAFVIE